MSDSYTAHGKQILCDGRHFADAVNDDIATTLAAVLNAHVEASLISFGEAEIVGQRLHDHWEKMMGSAPMLREDMGWGDIAQQTLRFTREVIDARPEMVVF